MDCARNLSGTRLLYFMWILTASAGRHWSGMDKRSERSNILHRIKSGLDHKGLLPLDFVQVDNVFQTSIQLLNYQAQGGDWLSEDFAMLGNAT